MRSPETAGRRSDARIRRLLSGIDVRVPRGLRIGVAALALGCAGLVAVMVSVTYEQAATLTGVMQGTCAALAGEAADAPCRGIADAPGALWGIAVARPASPDVLVPGRTASVSGFGPQRREGVIAAVSPGAVGHPVANPDGVGGGSPSEPARTLVWIALPDAADAPRPGTGVSVTVPGVNRSLAGWIIGGGRSGNSSA